MANIHGGSNTANVANVDAGYNLAVSLPQDNQYAGKAVMMCENDDGTFTGTAYLKSPEVSVDYRQRVGIDTILFSDTFNATAQNTNLWAYTFATLTAAQPGAGSVNFSTVQGTTNTHGAFMRTFQYFPVIGTAPLAVEVTAGLFTATLVANEVWMMGLGLPSAAVTEPTDGVWFRLTTAGLIGELRFNGTTTQTGVLRTLAQLNVGQFYKFVLVVGEREVEFWMDDGFLDEIAIPAGNGQPFIQGSLPGFMMKYNTGAVANTNTVHVSDFTCSLLDLHTSKPWAHQMSGSGQHSSVGQNGGTMGSTAGNFSQSAIVAAGAATNTALPVGHAAGLGGYYTLTAQASNVAAAGDMICSSYQNRASTINITGKNLIITGVTISCINTGAAVATTPTTLVWGLAYGHTAVSLATTETASFATATTHAPRRIPLGAMSAAVATAIGGMYSNEIARTFDSPIIVRPGEFIATTVRFLVGTATASQTVTCLIGFNGYWE